MVFILPWNPEFAVGGTQLYLHVICPIAILVSFELVESGYQITKRNTLACLIPFLIYSLVYVVNVVLLGETNGAWEDLYMLNTFVPFYFSLPAVWLLAYVIATLIRILSNRLDILRRNHLLSFWKEDADPIELHGGARHHKSYVSIETGRRKFRLPILKHFNQFPMYVLYRSIVLHQSSFPLLFPLSSSKPVIKASNRKWSAMSSSPA